MDNSNLKKFFGLAATNVTNLFQTSLKFQEEAYKKGKSDAYKEIIAVLVESSKGNSKNITQKDIIEFLQQKVAETEVKSTENMMQSSKTNSSDRMTDITNMSMGISTTLSNNANNTSNTMLIEAIESSNVSSNRFGGMNYESSMYNNNGGDRMQQQQQFNQAQGFLQNSTTQSAQNSGYTSTNPSKSQWQMKWQ